MAINLYISLYHEQNPNRQAELERCLDINLSNPLIDRIFIFEETGHSFFVEHEKITLVQCSIRPTFEFIFGVVNVFSGLEDLNIIANSDIFFKQDDIAHMAWHIKWNKCFALTRWNMVGDEAVFFGRLDSQDTWIFKGRIRPMNANFKIGWPGCDNCIAYSIQQAGYEITNPSLSIKSYHLHKDEHRVWHGSAPYMQPYLLLEPSAL